MAQHERLVRTLVSMADTLVDGYDIVEFLYCLSEACAELLHATACGVLLMDDGGQPELTAGTSLDMRTLAVFEGSSRQGPCYDAYVTGETVVAGDLRTFGDRWPGFVPRALDHGYVAALGQPLCFRGEPIGALDVYRDTPAPFDDDHVTISRGLADMAAIGIRNARSYARTREQVRNLQQLLESRATVEQAKAVLAERLGLSTEEAFHLLRGHARNHNRKLREVAQSYLDGQLPATSITRQ